MSKLQVTITLGTSGQKVVKGPWGNSDGRANARVLSGSKRSSRDSFGSNSDHSSSYINKRLRRDVEPRSSKHSCQIGDLRVGPKDLRLKLMHNRISRHMERGMEEHKKMELHEKVSRAIRSLESPERSLLKNISPTRRRAGTPLRSYYASWTLDELRPRFPDRVLRSSSGISSPRNTTDEVQWIQNDASTEHVLTSDILDPSRSRISLPMMSRAHVDAGKLVTRPPSSSGGISRGLYPDEQPLTVSGLLHSLGLGKYAIHFQAEEIDMAVLKQMGNRDLKELGIPMGPRKKILLAVLTLIKQSTAQAHCNYVH